jgi:hypothetical protein
MKTIMMINMIKNYKLILKCIYYDIIYFIHFKLSLFLLKIRIYYSLFILSIILVNEILKLILSLSLGDIINISDFLILSSNFESDNTNNQISSSFSSSTNQSEPTPPNSPNPISSDSSTALVQSINQDNNNNTNTNNPHPHINGNNGINGNNSINGINGHTNINGNTNSNVEIVDENSPVIFNEVEYDPQNDDAIFNPYILYPINHRFFEFMVFNHLANDNILGVIEAINNTTSGYWDDNSKLAAIEFIEEALQDNYN